MPARFPRIKHPECPAQLHWDKKVMYSNLKSALTHLRAGRRKGLLSIHSFSVGRRRRRRLVECVCNLPSLRGVVGCVLWALKPKAVVLKVGQLELDEFTEPCDLCVILQKDVLSKTLYSVCDCRKTCFQKPYTLCVIAERCAFKNLILCV